MVSSICLCSSLHLGKKSSNLTVAHFSRWVRTQPPTRKPSCDWHQGRRLDPGRSTWFLSRGFGPCLQVLKGPRNARCNLGEVGMDHCWLLKDPRKTMRKVFSPQGPLCWMMVGRRIAWGLCQKTTAKWCKIIDISPAGWLCKDVSTDGMDSKWKFVSVEAQSPVLFSGKPWFDGCFGTGIRSLSRKLPSVIDFCF